MIFFYSVLTSQDVSSIFVWPKYGTFLLLTPVSSAAHYGQQCCPLWSVMLPTIVSSAAHYGRHQKTSCLSVLPIVWAITLYSFYSYAY